jgi:hypothetical protein
VDDEHVDPRFLHGEHEPLKEPVVLELVDADAALDGYGNGDGFAHGDHALRDDLRFRHQARAEAAALDAVARTAYVEVDFVVTVLLTELCRARKQFRVGATKLQRDRMLEVIEPQQAIEVAVNERVGRHHLGVQQRARAQQP